MHNINDATMQANLGFVQAQTAHVETNVYKMRYPAIQYPGLIPVDTTANPWATSVTYYSQDQAGQAAWVNGMARDIPYADTAMQAFNTPVSMAAIGYRYSLEEVSQAAMLNRALTDDKASAARLAYEQFVDKVALYGDTTKGFQGLLNSTAVPVVAAAASWVGLTSDKILADLNGMITGVFTATNTVALADTILLPWERYNYIASTPRSDSSDVTILQYFLQNNVYTAQTGQPIMVRGVLGLSTIGAGGKPRAVAYRRSPDVLKLHIPMPHRFLPVQIILLDYVVPGIFRLGGLDIRLPKEITYLDGI